MKENELFTKKDSEISLIDLLAVIVSYRKFIICFTLVCSLIYFIFVAFFAKYLPANRNKKVTVVCSTTTPKIPNNLITAVSFDPSEEVISYYKDIMNFSEFHKSYNVFSYEGMSDRDYSTLMIKLYEDKNIYFAQSKTTSIMLYASVLEEKVNDFNSFITDYTKHCSDLIKKQMNEKLDKVIQKADMIIEKYDGVEDSPVDTTYYEMLKVDVENLIESDIDYLYLTSNPYEVVPAGETILSKIQGFLKMVCLFLIGGIVLSYLLCFIQRIKHNPEKSKIISDAWKAGK